MKNKIALFIICLLLVATQQGKAQSRADKALAEVAARKAEREKQLAHVRSKVAEQKGQLRHEKKGERTGALPPATPNGAVYVPNAAGAARTADSTTGISRSGRKM